MNILIIYPHGNALNPHSGAETRIWNLISILVKNQFNVFILHSIYSKGNEDKQLKKKCKVFYYREIRFKESSDWYISDLNPFFAFKIMKIIKNYNIDIIQLEFPWGFFITKLLAQNRSILIYDSQGVESEFMEISMKNPNFPAIFKPFAKVYAKLYEKLTCKIADLIISVSKIDKNFFIHNYNINENKIHLIQTPSSLVPQSNKRNKDYKLICRKKLNLPLNKTIAIFHGGLPHPPNQEAFDIIENYISPRINELDLFFVLAGHNLKKFEKGNIRSIGFVNDLGDLLYAADFAIVPLVSGSGMRIKCTDYIITGLPFITTQKGIEGINFLVSGEDYLSFKNVNEDFIKGIIKLSKNETIRKNFQRNLIEKSRFLNRHTFEKKFIDLYSSIKKLVYKKK